MKIPVNIPCCVCGSRESTVLFETVYPEYAYPETFTLCRCSSCGLLFNTPRLIDEEIAAMRVRNLDFLDCPEDEEFARSAEIYRRTVALVEKDIPQKSILQVSSGQGCLLAILNRLGWRTQGVESLTAMAETSRRRFGINVFGGSLAQFAADEHGNGYGLVLLSDSLEQSSSPADLLALAQKMLLPGGTLAVDTPNGNAYNINREQHRWQGFNPFNGYLFSEESLTRLLKQSGFEVKRVFSHSNDETRRSVFAAGAQELLRRTPLWNPLRRLWKKLRTPPPRPFDFYFNRFQEEIHRVPDYFATPDSNLGLRLYNRGDRLVAICGVSGG